ncbi:CG8326 [Drosophila busckii]|uniref:CG8326 n=1 Tax=Drosophila busckii TaxID=30019 RepID=A0A0M4FAJ6_DROBS|nr:CG8326 [Drosophila busckii]
MARKRKIPVRKHHGVRDPLKQIEQKEKKLANVTNNPPTQNDEQRSSHRFKQFKQLADAAKAGKRLKIGTIGKEDKPKATKNGRKTTTPTVAGSKHKNIKQLADETDEDYLRRVNRITNASVKEAQYEAKYGVNVIRNASTGEITLQKRPKNEIDELLKQKQKERALAKSGRKKNKGKQQPTMDAKTSKELIKRAFKEADEEEKQEVGPLAEYKHDVFKFGEIVHEPPTLKTLPRKANKNETVPRPGRKANLLLKSIMDPAITKAKTKAVTVGPPTKLQLKGKRKELPAATRNMLESERSKMIELYRQLKKTQNAA